MTTYIMIGSFVLAIGTILYIGYEKIKKTEYPDIEDVEVD